MEKTVKERLMMFIEYRGLSVSKFEKMCNLSNGYISKLRHAPGGVRLEEIFRVFPELNREWLLFGEGKMLNCPNNNNITQTINQQYANNPIGNVNGNIYNRSNDAVDVEPCECEDVPERLPIVPTAIAKKPSYDTLEGLMQQQQTHS